LHGIQKKKKKKQQQKKKSVIEIPEKPIYQ